MTRQLCGFPLWTAASIFASSLIITPAAAQENAPTNNCAPFATMAAGLAANWGEVPRVRALASAGGALVIFANDDSGTWTAIVVNQDGIGCIAAFGEAFEVLAEEIPGVDS